ncbi:MAG: tetratricopeptide repeat protein [Armatimonadota bacterium]|nr:tetratricopeptide repeat protein [Armatimonadota bacterium]
MAERVVPPFFVSGWSAAAFEPIIVWCGCTVFPRGISTMQRAREMSLNYRKGLEFFDQGLYVDALSAFEEALAEAQPDSPESRLVAFHIGETHARLAEECLRRGLRDRAELHLREAVARNPRYPDLHYQLAEILAQKGETDAAVTELDQALGINPKFARAWLLRGVLYYETGCHEEGLDYVARAVELEPRYNVPIYTQAIEAHSMQRHEQVVKLLRDLVALDIDDISFRFALGKNLYRAGDYEGAAEAFRQVLAVQSNYADVRNWLGLALMASSQFAEALEQFTRALEINPNYVAALINAGTASERLGLLEEAVGYYERALAVSPDNPEAAERLESLRKSRD